MVVRLEEVRRSLLVTEKASLANNALHMPQSSRRIYLVLYLAYSRKAGSVREWRYKTRGHITADRRRTSDLLAKIGWARRRA